MEVDQPKLPLFLCEVNSFVLFFPFTLLHFPLHWQRGEKYGFGAGYKGGWGGDL